MQTHYHDSKKNLKPQPRVKVVLLIALFCLIVYSTSFLVYHNLSHSVDVIKKGIFVISIVFSILLTLCILSIEMYLIRKKSQKKLIDKLKIQKDKCQELKDQLNFIANHDPRSHLPNQIAVEKKISETKEFGGSCTLLSLSLNNLYFISDMYGFSFADQLVQQIITRCQKIIDENILLARIQYDQFILVTTNMTSLNTTQLANQIHSALVKEFVINQQTVLLNCFIGIAYSNNEDMAPQKLIHQANMAVRKAKSSYDQKILTYHNNIQKELDDKKQQEQDLKNAINNDELCVFFQPQIDLRSGKIVGMEALVRWIDSNGNSIMKPEFIIQTAANSGLMVDLGYWIMETSLKQFSQLLDERCAPNLITINASKEELQDNNFIEQIKRLLEYYDIPASRVQIELSEQGFTDNIEKLIETINELSKIGLTLAINDFGKGYLSLSHLKDLPVSTLKIDRSFIKNLLDSKEDMVICQTIITMANLLQINSVSVGIENKHQQMLLQNLGCHIAQGRFLYEPMPFDSIIELLKKQRIKRFELSQEFS